MSLNMPSSPSPYSAPNTPIASSKRARIGSGKRENRSTELIRSPIRKLNIDDSDDRENERTRKYSPQNSGLVATTLFSPLLKFGVNGDEDTPSSTVEIQKSNNAITEMSQTFSQTNAVSSNDCTEINIEKDHEEEEFNPYLFISSLPPHSSVVSKDRECCLPRLTSTHSLTLVLDLDETLVHCTVEPIEKADLVFPVSFNGAYYQVFVKKRPYLDFFLETVSKSFEVVVFTASQKVYAERLLDLLDPNKNLIQHRLFRESCLCVYGNFIKDLEVLNRDLSKTVLVDNSPHAYGYQINNGIPIESWFDDETDTELLKLMGFLRKLQHDPSADESASEGGASLRENQVDVREVVKAHFKTHALVERAAAGQAVSLLAPPF